MYSFFRGMLLQFGMVPLNYLRNTAKTADYVVTGTWAKKAMEEASTQGKVRAAWDGKACSFKRMPNQNELNLDPAAAYVHICSNETIQGIQYPAYPDTGNVPLVCDASSDFLLRPSPSRSLRSCTPAPKRTPVRRVSRWSSSATT